MSEVHHDLFVCECADVSHQFIITRISDDPDLYVSVRLNHHLNFWDRLMAAVRFVFVHHGAEFDEVILNPEQQERLFTKLGQHAMTESE